MNLLMNPAYFKLNSTINGNIPDKNIQLAINEAQTTKLERIIGYTLVKKISDDGLSGSLTEPYLSLLYNYILPFMVKATEYTLSLDLYKTTNLGTINLNSDDATQVTLDFITKRQMTLNDLVNEYGDRLTRYLYAHSADFPEYTNMTDDNENYNPGTSSILYVDPEIHRRNVLKRNSKYN